MTTAAQLVSAADAGNWTSFKSLIASATPADIVAIGSDWNTVMSAIAEGVTGNLQPHKAIFTAAMTGFFSAAGPYLTGDSVAAALTSIAENSGVDHLSVELTAILKAVPASVAVLVPQESLTNLLLDIANNQGNPEVTPVELKNTFAALVEKFGAHLDVDAILITVSSLTNGSSFPQADPLASVRVLLGASPANAASVTPAIADNALSNISFSKYNADVTPADLNSTLKVFGAHYGAVLDVNVILSAARALAEDFTFPSQDYLAAVRTLLSFNPANAASVSATALQEMMTPLVFSINNPTVTPEELNATVKVFVSHYGAFMSAEFLVDAAENFASAGAQTPMDYLATVRTLLSADGLNPEAVNPFSLSNVLTGILHNQLNPSVTSGEFDSTIKVFVAHYGAQTQADILLSAASFILSTDSFSALDHSGAVRALLNAAPADIAFASPFAVQDVLNNLVFAASNPVISPDELNGMMRAFTTHYGAALDAESVLGAISSIANTDHNFGTDHFSTLNTLLDFHPVDAGSADAGTLSSALQEINFNAGNTAVSDHELAQTWTKYIHGYGALTPTADLAQVISDEVQFSRFEAAGAVANHLTASQFTEAATDLSLDPFAGAVQLLTTGHDHYTGTTAGATAVYGGAGSDSIDFSAATDSHYLDGGAGADKLIGGLGDDVLNGGAGTDTLTGGGGADTFRFDHAGGAPDHVTDFNAGQGDRLDLHDVLHLDGGAAISDYVSLQTVGGNTIVSVDKDGAGSGSGFVAVAQLDGVTGLDVNDLYAHGQIIAG